MKRILPLIGAVGIAAMVVTPASAFQQITHKRIAIDAINYMKAHPDTTNYTALEKAVTAAGYTIDQFAETVGQGAFDVDDFQDTFICGAITGDCVYSPVFNAGASIAQYTSYWHFQNHTRGGDAHGNDLGGYNYDLLTVWGVVDDLAATWLVNDHLDDGNGGMTGFCYWFLGCSEDSEYNSYGITEANYRQGSYSTKGMYEDFQDIPFQPIDNLGNYWYSQFLNSPTAQTLGFVLHTTDLLQPHHTWTTSDLNHSGWESWVADYYDSENLNADDKVTEALASFTPIDADATDIRPLLTEGGSISYSLGGAVLNTTDHNARREVANVVIPHAIAMAINIFNHAADKMSTNASGELREKRAGLCMNLWGGVAKNGADVRLHSCSNSANEQWQYESSTGLIRSTLNTNYCLDMAGGQVSNGGNVQVWSCIAGHNNMTWDIVGDTIRPRVNHGIAIDAYGTRSGDNIGLWSVHGGSNQSWTVEGI